MSQQPKSVEITPEDRAALPTLANHQAVVDYAAILNIKITKRTVRDATASGELRHRKISYSHRWSEKDVRDWLIGPSNYPAPGEAVQ